MSFSTSDLFNFPNSFSTNGYDSTPGHINSIEAEHFLGSLFDEIDGTRRATPPETYSSSNSFPNFPNFVSNSKNEQTEQQHQFPTKTRPVGFHHLEGDYHASQALDEPAVNYPRSKPNSPIRHRVETQTPYNILEKSFSPIQLLNNSSIFLNTNRESQHINSNQVNNRHSPSRSKNARRNYQANHRRQGHYSAPNKKCLSNHNSTFIQTNEIESKDRPARRPIKKIPMVPLAARRQRAARRERKKQWGDRLYNTEENEDSEHIANASCSTTSDSQRSSQDSNSPDASSDQTKPISNQSDSSDTRSHNSDQTTTDEGLDEDELDLPANVEEEKPFQSDNLFALFLEGDSPNLTGGEENGELSDSQSDDTSNTQNNNNKKNKNSSNTREDAPSKNPHYMSDKTTKNKSHKTSHLTKTNASSSINNHQKKSTVKQQQQTKNPENNKNKNEKVNQKKYNNNNNNNKDNSSKNNKNNNNKVSTNYKKKNSNSAELQQQQKVDSKHKRMHKNNMKNDANNFNQKRNDWIKNKAKSEQQNPSKNGNNKKKKKKTYVEMEQHSIPLSGSGSGNSSHHSTKKKQRIQINHKRQDQSSPNKHADKNKTKKKISSSRGLQLSSENINHLKSLSVSDTKTSSPSSANDIMCASDTNTLFKKSKYQQSMTNTNLNTLQSNENNENPHNVLYEQTGLEIPSLSGSYESVWVEGLCQEAVERFFRELPKTQQENLRIISGHDVVTSMMAMQDLSCKCMICLERVGQELNRIYANFYNDLAEGSIFLDDSIKLECVGDRARSIRIVDLELRDDDVNITETAQDLLESLRKLLVVKMAPSIEQKLDNNFFGQLRCQASMQGCTSPPTPPEKDMNHHHGHHHHHSHHPSSHSHSHSQQQHHHHSHHPNPNHQHHHPNPNPNHHHHHHPSHHNSPHPNMNQQRHHHHSHHHHDQNSHLTPPLASTAASSSSHNMCENISTYAFHQTTNINESHNNAATKTTTTPCTSGVMTDHHHGLMNNLSDHQMEDFEEDSEEASVFNSSQGNILNQDRWIEQLEEMRLGEFADKFRAEGWDDIDLWPEMTDEDLLDLGFKKEHIFKWRTLYRSLRCPDWWLQMEDDNKERVKSLLHNTSYTLCLIQELAEETDLMRSDAKQFLDWWYGEEKILNELSDCESDISEDDCELPLAPTGSVLSLAPVIIQRFGAKVFRDRVLAAYSEHIAFQKQMALLQECEQEEKQKERRRQKRKQKRQKRRRKKKENKGR